MSDFWDREAEIHFDNVIEIIRETLASHGIHGLSNDPPMTIKEQRALLAEVRRAISMPKKPHMEARNDTILRELDAAPPRERSKASVLLWERWMENGADDLDAESIRVIYYRLRKLRDKL